MDVNLGLYGSLGSRRLSSLVKQDYRTSVEIPNAKPATELRRLILERLPLFLHEHTHAKTKISYSWMNSDGNFIVRSFGKLSVTKSISFGRMSDSQTQDASAVATRSGKGRLELWVAAHSQIDYYESVKSSIYLDAFLNPFQSGCIA